MIPGKYFTHNSLEDEDVLFINAHRTACELLAEVRPGYGDRRLGSQVSVVYKTNNVQAIPLAIFLMIEEDVEETEDEALKALFVEAFGDRQKFFNICIQDWRKRVNH